MKKSRKRLIKLFFWALIAAGAVWIAIWPTPHKATKSVNVKVEHVTEAPPPATGDEKVVELVAPPPITPVEPIRPHLLGKPRIAIVIDDMGLDMRDSRRAVALPGAITLSYLPYATRLREQAREAKEAGHELLLHMPMEPVGHDNPGPGALLVNLPPDEIRERFQTALASFTGFDGVNNHMGSKFTAHAEGMEIVVDELQQRGLFFLDSRTNSKTVGESVAREKGLPTIARDVFLDDDINMKSIMTQLSQVENVARRRGHAVAIGHPHPVTLEALEQWIPEAEKRGFELVAVRELVESGR